MTVPRAECIHRTAGRFRVSIPSAKGNAELLLRVQEELSRCQLVQSASGNPLTGSILVLHQGDFREIASYAEARSLFTLTSKKKGTDGIARTTVAGYRKVDAAIKRVSGGELDLPHAVFVGFLGTGVLQILRGKLGAPAWYTAFWYAFNVFHLAHGKNGKR